MNNLLFTGLIWIGNKIILTREINYLTIEILHVNAVFNSSHDSLLINNK